MIRRIAAAAALAAALAVPAAAQAHLVTEAQAAHSYLVAITPYNAALTTFDAKVHHFTWSTPNAVAVAAARPLIRAGEQLTPRLEAIDRSYPLTAPDIRVLISAEVSLTGALAHASTTSVMESQGTFGSAVGAAQIGVRGDFGLSATGVVIGPAV